jgi:hypothetical protein
MESKKPSNNPFPTDDPEIEAAKKDPMEELFGPGSGIFHHPEEDDSPPEELLEIFAEHGIGQLKYNCILKEKPRGGSQYIPLQTMTGSYPSTEYITNNFGPGEYRLVFFWKRCSTTEFSEGGNPKRTPFSKWCDVVISEKLRQQYSDFQLRKRLADMKEKRKLIQEAQLDKVLDYGMDGLGLAADPEKENRENTPTVNPAEAGRKYVQEVMNSADMLGLTKKSEGFDFAKFIAAAAPFIPALLDYLGQGARRAQEQQQQFMNLILTTMSGNSNQLIEIMKANQGNGAAQNAVKEFKEMISGAIDIRGELSGMGKETVADKVFKLLEGLAGHVVPLLMMPRAQAMSDPRMKIAQAYAAASPDIAEIRDNPEELSKLVRELDDFYGWEQANGILAVMKFGRPADCPCEPGKRFPDGDPRNALELEAIGRAVSQNGSMQARGMVPVNQEMQVKQEVEIEDQD